jgi:DNA-3-methyladenine glycosylase II
MSYDTAVAHLRAADPRLDALIDRIGPCGLAAAQESFELYGALAGAIVAQQLSTKAAATIWKRFVALYPPHDSPPPERVMESSDELLRSVGLSRQKIGYLRDLSGRLPSLPTLDTLHQLEDEAIISSLTQVKGIGRWTVQMLLIFRLGRPDVLPVDDLGIRAAVKQLYGLGELPGKKELEGLAAPWRPHASVACWYLWRSLNNQ